MDSKHQQADNSTPTLYESSTTLIIESSWEVCNKQGGIYTVLSSRAHEMMIYHKERIIFVGPLLNPDQDTIADFEPCQVSLLSQWQTSAQNQLGLRTSIGRWRIPGTPPVILVDYTPLRTERDALYYEMWEHYGLQSELGYGDYEDSCLFAIASARVMLSLYATLQPSSGIAIFNEWQTAMGLLYLDLHLDNDKVKTLFITHATTVGRSIAGNDKALYAYMPGYNGNQMASELGVTAKHSVEKLAAHRADIFATVSEITARECHQLLERAPIILPNGFEPRFVPQGEEYHRARIAAREQLLQVASLLYGETISQDACLISLGGRYEYRNKGIDLFVESIATLTNSQDLDKELVAYLLVPAWSAGARADLQYLLRERRQAGGLQHPYLTHWLHNMEYDTTCSHLRYRELLNGKGKVRFVFVPVYLDGKDGVFGMSYYDLLIGMDLTLYPSYYEPWGYTPLESIAFGVPTITTTLAGFGLWALQKQQQIPHDIDFPPVYVVERGDGIEGEVVNQIAHYILSYTKLSLERRITIAHSAQELARQAEWKHFYPYYIAAYQSALHTPTE